LNERENVDILLSIRIGFLANHLGTKFFLILLRHSSSSPSTFPSLFLSHPGSFNPKMLKIWLIEVASIDVRVLLESSSELRSALRALATFWFASLLRLLSLNDL
jgi:hypothetical protein